MAMHVGIIGAGIGGLCSAIALKKIGLNVSVYERSSSPGGYGAGLQLSPNASRILRALGLLEEVEAHSFKPKSVLFRSWQSGYQIASYPLGEITAARHGAPYLHIHRGDLHRVLLKKAESLGVNVLADHRLLKIHQAGDRVQLEFNALTQQHDLVIGCDGVKSTVRNQLFDQREPHFTGHVAYRGILKSSDLGEQTIAPSATVWLGPHKHFVHYYVKKAEYVNFVAVAENQNWKDESWSVPADKGELLDQFSGWHPSLTSLIENTNYTNNCFKWALHERETLPSWTRGRIALLGDAAHPMQPYLAQGAAMAIEDAWVLSRMLEQFEGQPEQALGEYQKYRKARTSKMQLKSVEQGETFHASNFIDVSLRNLKLGLGSRYLPELTMQHLDWIHGYDAVKGFH